MRTDKKQIYELMSWMFNSAQHEYKPHKYKSPTSLKYDKARKKFNAIMKRFCREKELEFKKLSQ